MAEYTEFKVHVKRKHNWKRVEKQFRLDKDLIRLCIMRCFHPDKLMQEIKSFIVHFLGKYFVELPRFDFKSFLQRTNKRTPTLFMVGPNVNCQQELTKLMQSDITLSKQVIEYQPLGSIEL